MTCKWCDEDNDIIKLCNVKDHSICKTCYDKYHNLYPLRVKGCPYCKGLQENVIVYVHEQHNNSIPYEVISCIICYSLIFVSIKIYFLIILFSNILNNNTYLFLGGAYQ